MFVSSINNIIVLMYEFEKIKDRKIKVILGERIRRDGQVG